MAGVIQATRHCARRVNCLTKGSRGEVAEWLKALAWNAGIGETLSWVRIPPSPPFPPLAVKARTINCWSRTRVATESAAHSTGASSTATVDLDLGDDSAIDTVTFEGSVASSGATVTIINFDPLDGDTIVLQLYSNTADVTFTRTGGGSGTRVNASDNVKFLIQGVPTGSLEVTTNTSGHFVIAEAALILT